MSYILFYFIFLSSLLFIFMNHPLSLGLILLIQTILIALLTGLMNYSYWFSYILFLIMIGGMLILFIYMTSIASNEKFKISYKLTLLSLIMSSIMFMLLFTDLYFINMFMNMMDLVSNNINPNFKITLNKFINWNMMNNFFLIILYLLITLIMVVKITNIKSGPLRQKT